MSIMATQEYKVLLTQKLLAESADGQSTCWRAMVLGFPYLVEEATSREQVIAQIQTRVEELIRNAEIITLTAPALPKAQNGADDELAAQGWDDRGLFKFDPEALKLFDEIEEERDRHLVGGE